MVHSVFFNLTRPKFTTQPYRRPGGEFVAAGEKLQTTNASTAQYQSGFLGLIFRGIREKLTMFSGLSRSRTSAMKQHAGQVSRGETEKASTSTFQRRRGLHRCVFPVFVILVSLLILWTFCDFVLLLHLYTRKLVRSRVSGGIIGFSLLFPVSAATGRAFRNLGFYIMACGSVFFLVYGQNLWLEAWMAVADPSLAMDMLFVYSALKVALTLLVIHWPK